MDGLDTNFSLSEIGLKHFLGSEIEMGKDDLFWVRCALRKTRSQIS